jgi:hypothetical protein
MTKESIPPLYSFNETIIDTCKVEESSEVKLITPKKKSFEEAIADCNGVSIDTFFNELDERIKRRFNG